MKEVEDGRYSLLEGKNAKEQFPNKFCIFMVLFTFFVFTFYTGAILYVNYGSV